MSKEELQKKYVELQELNEKLKQMQQAMQNLEQQFLELGKLSESLEDIKKFKQEDLFVPLGGGIFVEGKLVDSKKVLMNVGSNVLVKKNIDDAKKIVNEQIEDIKKIIENISEELNKGVEQSQKLQEEVEKLSSEKD